MRRHRRALLRTAVVSAVLVIGTLVAYHVLRQPGEGHRFADPGVETSVRRALGDPEGPLRRHDLDRLTHLDAAWSDIRILDDLRELPNLRTLDLSGNAPSSLDPIAAHHHLRELRLSGLETCGEEGIDLRPLVELRALERIDLSHNPACSRFAGLEQLTSLRELSLRDTGLPGLEQIAPLIRLQRLDLRETDLAEADLDSLRRIRALEHLNLRETGVRDVSVLRELTTLRYLNLHSNTGIASLDPIRGLRRLRTLILRNVPLQDPTVLDSLVELRRLNVRNTGLRDFDVLAALMESGALQDDHEAQVVADVDIRDNPVGSDNGVTAAYDALRPYWSRISLRKPERLPRAPTRDLVINEVMTSNGGAFRTDDGDHPDWIEIHNRLDRTVDLEGFYLSGSSDDPHQWRIPSQIPVRPGGFVVIPAGTTGAGGTGDRLRAPFALSSDGVSIRLTAPDGRTLVDEIDVPPIARDTSYGLVDEQPPPEGGEQAVFALPSPGRANAEGRRAVALRFSHPAGFYRDEFPLVISAEPPDESTAANPEVFYTLDGSIPEPGSDHTHRYEGPIAVRSSSPEQRLSDIPTTVPAADKWEWKPPEDAGFQATVVRAAVFDDDRLSEVASHTYFVDSSIDDRFTTPVVSLLAEPAELFGYEQGIYVPGRHYEENLDPEVYWMRHPANYTLRREVGAHVEFYDVDGYRGFDVDAGVRIHGGWSRSHPLKSLRLYARKDYGRVDAFEYPLFSPDAAGDRRDVASAPTRYRRLMLRSGQSLFRSHLQDALLSEHLADTVDVALMRSRPVVHFINGEYWGLQNLRERFDRFYLEQRYGVDPETVVVLEGALGLDAGLKNGSPEDARDYRRLLERVETRDMTDADEYRYVADRVDIDSFIDYNVVRMYSGDPDGVSKHVTVWRSPPTDSGPPPADGRWRWHTWDLDNSLLFLNEDTMSFYANDEMPPENEVATGDSEYVQMLRDPEFTALVVGLFENPGFRNRFINRFADLLNTHLHPDALVPAIREAAGNIADEMPFHIARWGYPESLEYWRAQVDHHVSFAHLRPDVQREHIIDYFRRRDYSISDVGPVTVAVPESGGKIRLNSLMLDETTPGVRPGSEWSGLYFGGVPVELTAEPEPGYRFAGWGGDAPGARRNRAYTRDRPGA